MSLPFPNVPNLPGVPQIPRSPSFTPTEILTLGTDAIAGQLWQAAQQPPSWGVFDSSNTQVITPDSVVDFGLRAEWDVSSFPVQQGSFATYNKVVVPAQYSVRMTKGGSQSDRTNFENQISAIAGNTNLYTILTPENSYPNCNITRYEITRRGAAGAYFIDVDLFFITINQVTAQFQSTQNAQDPTARGATNTGTLQPINVDSATQSAIAAVPTF